MTIRRGWRQWLLHSFMLAVFLCASLWYRLPAYLPIFAPLYVTRFLVFVLMVVTTALWLLFGVPGLRAFAREPWRALWALALLALVFWGFASTSWAFIGSQHPEVGESAALQLGVTSLFALAVACAGPRPRAVIAALVVVLIANSLITFGQVAAQSALGLSLLGEFAYSDWSSGASYVRAGDLQYHRPYGLLPHPNMLAGVLVIGLLASAAWVLSDKRWQRNAGALLVAGGVYALVLTFSRAAWGALVVGGLLALPLVLRRLRQPEIRRGAAAAVMLAAAACLIFAISYRPLLAARAGEGQELIELRSVSDRIVFTQFALQSVSERPLLGVGIGNFPWRASYYLVDTFYDLRGDNVHNIYLSAWAEIGTVGLALFLAAMAAGGIAAVKAIRARADAARIALLACFIALAAVGMLDHYPYTTIQFQMLWWGCLAAALAPPADQA